MTIPFPKNEQPTAENLKKYGNATKKFKKPRVMLAVVSKDEAGHREELVIAAQEEINEQKIKKRLCLNCGKKLKPDLSAVNFKTKKWDKHSYKCDCMPKLRISIG